MAASGNTITDSLFPSRPWPNAIVHMDGDAFFASCEQALHPEYRGRPVITGQERNIVASMSYEAKARGVKRGTALREIKKVCPDAIIVPSDYETYSELSQRMFSIMLRFTPRVEEASIDEGYLELNGLDRLYHLDYAAIALRIKQAIEEELGLSISAGVSVTKTLAKLAAKRKKPRGFVVVPADQIPSFLEDIPVREICGIGPNSAALLNKKEVHTALDYAMKPQTWISSLLGKPGRELWLELRGCKVFEVDTAPKTSYDSISKAKTFTPPSRDFQYIKAQLYRNAESAFIKLRRYSLTARRLFIFLREQNFSGRHAEGTVARPTSSFFEVFPLLEGMLKQIYRPAALYRQTGIVLAALEHEGHRQFELFEDAVKPARMQHLAMDIDEINGKYGKHTVGCGMKLYIDGKVRTDPLRSSLAERKPVYAKREGGSRPDTKTAGKSVRLERWELPARKKALLPGETRRQRLGIPVLCLKL